LLIFPTPLSFGTPLPMYPLEFRAAANQKATRVMGYPPVKTACSWHDSYWHNISVWRTDRQTDIDRQTDGFTIAKTALCIASYADAL